MALPVLVEVIEFTNTGATTITLPTGLTTGFQAVLTNVGGGNKTLSAGSGATLYTLNNKTVPNKWLATMRNRKTGIGNFRSNFVKKV
jgi:hypothetical protein